MPFWVACVFPDAGAATLPDGSAADVYVDIGAIIRGSGDEVDPEAKSFLETAGIEPDEPESFHVRMLGGAHDAAGGRDIG